jgi:hypothetical protein
MLHVDTDEMERKEKQEVDAVDIFEENGRERTNARRRRNYRDKRAKAPS